MKVIVNGAGGRIGAEMLKLLDEGSVIAVDMSGTSNAAKTYKTLDEVTEQADVIVDFSSHLATAGLTAYAAKRGLPVVIATTGQTAEEMQMIKDAAKKVAVFKSANMSLGVALLVNLAKQAAAVMRDADVEIVEIHHNHKADAPSGTALMLADAVKQARQGGEIVCGRNGNSPRCKGEIGISSVRLANVVGEHEVMISDGTETITLKHQAHDKALFAKGALAVAGWITGKAAGLYDMQDMLGK